MNKIIDYVVICSSDEEIIQEEIIEYGKKGYVLAGGLSVSQQINTHNEDCECFDILYQAMVKYESDNTNN